MPKARTAVVRLRDGAGHTWMPRRVTGWQLRVVVRAMMIQYDLIPRLGGDRRVSTPTIQVLFSCVCLATPPDPL